MQYVVLFDRLVDLHQAIHDEAVKFAKTTYRLKPRKGFRACLHPDERVLTLKFFCLQEITDVTLAHASRNLAIITLKVSVAGEWETGLVSDYLERGFLVPTHLANHQRLWRLSRLTLRRQQ